MPKNYNIADFIIKKLENGGLTGKELKDMFNQDDNLEKPYDVNKSFGHAFHRLLFNGVIQIDGYYNAKRFKYDPKLDKGEISKSEYRRLIRNRNLEWDDLIYSLVVTEPAEISLLIKQLDDPEKGMECFVKLRKLFIKKMEKIYELNLQEKGDEIGPFEISKVYAIFDDLVSYINSIETGRAALIQRLSIGLSNKKESINFLDELIEESYYMEHGES